MAMKKRLLSILCVFALTVFLFTPALAVEKQEIVDLGDGFYAVITLSQEPATRAGDVAKGSKTGSVYQGGTKIGEATFVAEFDISGATARVTSAKISGNGMNGWDYSRSTTGRSGNTATGTAYFTDGNIIRSLTLTLTCSPSGVIS